VLINHPHDFLKTRYLFPSLKSIEKGASKDKADSVGARWDALSTLPSHLNGMMVAHEWSAIFTREAR